VNTEVARLDLRSRRKSQLGYAIGLGLYTLVIVALYPAFKNSTQLDDLLTNSPTISALFGISGSLTSPDGWANANLYSNFLPLILLLLTIGYGAAAIAGEEEAGRLDLVLGLPVPRRQVILEKAGAMAWQAGFVSIVTFLCMLVGRAFDLDLGVWNLATTTFGVMLLAVGFGLLALALGGGRGDRGIAIGVSATLAAVAYLLSSLAPVVSWLDPWKVLSPFYWAVGNGQLTTGLGWDGLLVLLGFVAVMLVVAVAAFEAHDLRG
jgi:ABC-2 type transport system permease protein